MNQLEQICKEEWANNSAYLYANLVEGYSKTLKRYLRRLNSLYIMDKLQTFQKRKSNFFQFPIFTNLLGYS